MMVNWFRMKFTVVIFHFKFSYSASILTEIGKYLQKMFLRVHIWLVDFFAVKLNQILFLIFATLPVCFAGGIGRSGGRSSRYMTEPAHQFCNSVDEDDDLDDMVPAFIAQVAIFGFGRQHNSGGAVLNKKGQLVNTDRKFDLAKQ